MAHIEKMKDLALKHLKAFTDGDWATYKKMFTENATYEEEATGRKVQGPDKIADLVGAWRRAFPDMKARIKEAIVTADAVVAEVEWSGTHKGTLTGPFGTINATNKYGTLPAVIVYRFDDESVRELRHYFDVLTLLAQLGVMPQLGASAPR